MLYRRTGFPEIDEIVLCKVTTIFPNSVFVDLLEYQRQGMVHISEIAPGRIRNLREYVSEGRQIICKVLRIDREKGHIDLSLRRVNSVQRGEKLEEVKQELKAETVTRNLGKKLNQPVEAIYGELTKKLFPEYSHLYLAFQDVVAGELDLLKKGVDKTIAEEITAAVIEKFKPKSITIKGSISLQTYARDGVGKIKATLQKIEQVSPTLKVTYTGGGKFQLVIEDFDYKPAEKTMSTIEAILGEFRDKLSTATLEREKSE